MAFESYEEDVDVSKYQHGKPVDDLPEDDDVIVADEPDELEIEVVDDRAADDRGKKNAHQVDDEDFNEGDLELPADLDNEDERSKFIKSAQQRVKETTFRFHAERRSREEAERQANAALELAKSYMTQIGQLQTSYKANEHFAVGELAKNAESNIELLGQQLQQAHVEADAASIVKITRQLNDEQLKLAQLKAYRPAEFRAPNAEQDFAVIAPRVAAAQRPAVDDATLQWAGRNPWFNKNPEMTAHAQAIDAELTARGVNPLTDSKTYFTTIDSEMKRRFPNHPWLGSPRASPPPVVTAGAKRSSPQVKGKVTLTRSQIEVARHLGITPEAYAKELRKLTRGDKA